MNIYTKSNGTEVNNTRAKMTVPGWLLEGSHEDAIQDPGHGMYLFKKMAVKISKAFQEDLLAERYAAKDMLMQGVDPRIKLITLIILMIITGMAPNIPSMVVLMAAAIMLVILSGLDMTAFLRRVWLVIPLLLLFSIPAASNLFIPGVAVLVIFNSHTALATFLKHPDGVFFTLQGVDAVIKIFLRTGISISFGYILIMTTRWSVIVASLRSIKLPAIFVGILSMTYRYIFVLVQVSQEMFEARYLRTVGKISNKDNRRFLSGRIALLFIKSSSISEEIYDAMLCRCYTGEISGYGAFRISRNDFLWLANFVVIMLIVLLF
jgi:cobalt/nickel transport system permease protein